MITVVNLTTQSDVGIITYIQKYFIIDIIIDKYVYTNKASYYIRKSRRDCLTNPFSTINFKASELIP